MSDHYKELLIKYMQHVGCCEGTVFLWESSPALTDAELVELRSLYEQAQPINEIVHSVSISSDGE